MRNEEVGIQFAISELVTKIDCQWIGEWIGQMSKWKVVKMKGEKEGEIQGENREWRKENAEVVTRTGEQELENKRKRRE
ncbi:unnamed protein product [[Candida] boidinii]|uniref:Unnamed protein product n=1 Tax=Candida boidinii TaxID=5477 RepID=A0A9W6T772_CANBO|nr:unnamed protein product [[Candida] boidinii]GMF52184.1 unnamed protein product [[Candida] boidinii]GMG00414.1 unnamed protein product [[Candida] boidinii]